MKSGKPEHKQCSLRFALCSRKQVHLVLKGNTFFVASAPVHLPIWDTKNTKALIFWTADGTRQDQRVCGQCKLCAKRIVKKYEQTTGSYKKKTLGVLSPFLMITETVFGTSILCCNINLSRYTPTKNDTWKCVRKSDT